MCTESQRRRDPITSREVERGARWGKAHSQQRKGSETEFKKIQGHGTNIPKWDIEIERWDQEWVGWEQTVKGHGCSDREFGLYPPGFWGPSEIFHPRKPTITFLFHSLLSTPLMEFWAPQGRCQPALITFLLKKRHRQLYPSHCVHGSPTLLIFIRHSWNCS